MRSAGFPAMARSYKKTQSVANLRNPRSMKALILACGGIPIERDGVVIGAVGASGGSVKQDVAVAEAAATGFTG
jgi:uncharacterized protein GlcG (DUF336 family)